MPEDSPRTRESTDVPPDPADDPRANQPQQRCPRHLKVGESLIDCATGEILRGGTRTELEPRVFEVLEYLIENAGRPVSKDELLEAVWNGAYVTEYALWRAISKLRKALGDDWRHPRVVATLPKRGYMFVAQVEAAGSAAAPEREPSAVEESSSIGTGRRLAAGRLFSGSLLFLLAALGLVLVGDGDSAPLSPTASWSENAGQIEMLERQRKSIGLGPESLSVLSIAYSRQWSAFASTTSDRRWLDAALDAASDAIENAPTRPEGFLARGYARRSAGRLEEAEHDYRRALDLDPDSLEAANDLGHLLRDVGRLEEAIAWHDKVLAERPDYYPSRLGRAMALTALTRYSEAESEALAALQEEPHLVGASTLLIRIALLEGDSTRAKMHASVLSTEAASSPAVLEALAAIAHIEGDLEGASALLHRATGPENKGGIGAAALRLAAVSRGLGNEALYHSIARTYSTWITSEEQAGSEHWRADYWRAAFASMDGRPEDSMKWLERATDKGFRGLPWVALDPVFRDLNRSEAFVEWSRAKRAPTPPSETPGGSAAVSH